MKTLFFILILQLVLSSPDLLTLSSRNSCIKSIVDDFISHSTCSKLTQETKSMVTFSLTSVGPQNDELLILAHGQDAGTVYFTFSLRSPRRFMVPKHLCRNTFTTFFTHIDNLCHFYWDVSKAERTEQMIEVLLTSASSTAKSLEKNHENTNQILELQTNLKLQILNSMATQEQMN